MNYKEDATQAAHFLREAIPLMVKYNIHPNPRNFALWYAYVSKRNPKLNEELDKTIQQYDTCPPNTSADLFRRYVIDDEVEFAHHVQHHLSDIIGKLSSQTEKTLEGEQTFETQLEEGLKELQKSAEGGNVESVIHSLIEHTKNASKVAEKFRSEINQANSEIEMLRRELKELAEEASLDSLTQLNNRRAFDKEIERLLSEYANSAENLCLLMTDIDHFKKCNDTYGHVVGDKVLQSFAKVLDHVCSKVGFPARYGGEEFVVLLPDHSLESAEKIAEKIRATTESMQIKQRGSGEPIDRVTTSLGVAQYQPKEHAQEFINRADNALYQAKEGGRNQVISAPLN